MSSFVGEHTSKLDEKGRMVFPSELKNRLMALGQKSLIVKKDFYQKCLTLYTLEAWNELTASMRERLNLFNKDHAALWREFMRDRAEITPDEKNGRISIPRQLLDKIDVDKEVVFVGMEDRIELWAKDTYAKVGMSEEEFSDAIAKYLG